MEDTERGGIADTVTRAAMREQSRRGMLKTLGTWGLAIGAAATGVSLSSTKALASPQTIWCTYGQCSCFYSSTRIDNCGYCIYNDPTCSHGTHQAVECVDHFGNCTCNTPPC